MSSVDARAQVAADAGPIVVPPVRRTSISPPAPPPALPDGAADIGSFTLEVTIRRDGTGRPETSTHQVITRTNRRVHLKVDADREWLFERNPVDHRRVEGWLVVHSRRTIVMYDESGLRNWLGVRGWADVLTLGLDVRALSLLTPTGEFRSEAGLRFARYTIAATASNGIGHGVRDVWWCVDQALPLQFTMHEADVKTTVSVERINAAVDEGNLRIPAGRFPDYREIDLAEWLEDL
jgi:hypothetical protein